MTKTVKGVLYLSNIVHVSRVLYLTLLMSYVISYEICDVQSSCQLSPWSSSVVAAVVTAHQRKPSPVLSGSDNSKHHHHCRSHHWSSQSKSTNKHISPYLTQLLEDHLEYVQFLSLDFLGENNFKVLFVLSKRSYCQAEVQIQSLESRCWLTKKQRGQQHTTP